MSAWNPIDGWVSSKPSKMEVLARVGPITIDDYLIVSDSVSNNDTNSHYEFLHMLLLCIHDHSMPFLFHHVE